MTSNPYSAKLFFVVKKISLFTILFLIIVLPSSNAFTFEGPMQVKNQFPLFIHLNATYLETARIENSFSANLSHSSVYLVRESSEWFVGIDMEVTELNLRMKKTIKDFLEIGVDIPIISFNSGFMDGFLNSYHETFGFPNYGRSNRPENEFLYEVKREGVLIIDGKGGHIAIGDIRLSVKKPILNDDPAISIQGDIELPIGDAKNGYGNGSIDVGITLMVDKKLSEKFKSYCNVGIGFPGDLEGHEKVGLKTFVYGGTGVEAYLLKNLTMLGQLFIQGSPYPKTYISAVDRTAMLLSLGGRYYLGKNSLELSFTEDPNTSGAPDFTVSFSFKRKF